MKVAKIEFSLFGVATYIVYDSDNGMAAIIDPGMVNQDEERKLKTFIDDKGLTVSHVINTHLHVEHSIGNRFASETFQVPVLAHKYEESFSQNMRKEAADYGLSEQVRDLKISKYVVNGEKIKIGNGELEVLHVPGHSPGSIALYNAADGFVLVGDTLYADSIGRTDRPGSDMYQLVSSIRRQLLTLPESTVVWPGHGPTTTIHREAVHNSFLR